MIHIYISRQSALETGRYDYDRRQLLKIQNRNKFLIIMEKRGRCVWAKN